MRNRIKVAIQALKEGQFFSLDNIRLGVSELGEIEVAGWSKYSNIENITKRNSMTELNEIKGQFFEMVENSSELKEFIQEKKVRYTLYYDDYGKASVSICSEINGVIEWQLT